MSMEETAVLLSIRPEWCQKIFRGEKTMEIRKNFPKDFQGQPFKCFIYCTKGQNAGFRMEPDGSLLRLDGTVIGEFTCDRVYEIAPLNHAPDDRVEDDVIAALSECLRHFDIMNYTEESKPAPPFEASTSASRAGRIRSQSRAMRASAFWMGPPLTSAA